MTNILAKRLDSLVEAGVLERRSSNEPSDRSGYSVTRKGLDLAPVIIALTEWGDRWAAPTVRPSCIGTPVAAGRSPSRPPATPAGRSPNSRRSTSSEGPGCPEALLASRKNRPDVADHGSPAASDGRPGTWRRPARHGEKLAALQDARVQKCPGGAYATAAMAGSGHRRTLTNRLVSIIVMGASVGEKGWAWRLGMRWSRSTVTALTGTWRWFAIRAPQWRSRWTRIGGSSTTS
ncbi:winged helix-turn-helix transcriptional regulator [Nonomuraea sp. NPDC051191]|uniref:winged helix-turn-helix transcriptional regulator n=1 Tax=Nonomuraea sp. NPDC051191 TaxID=3364372 RepID=UPI0037BC2D5D